MSQDILAFVYARMDDIEGPIVDASWAQPSHHGILSRNLEQKSLVSLLMLASAENCPRVMTLSDTTCVLSPHENNLLVLFLEKNAPFDLLNSLWKRVRIIHGKSNGDSSRMMASLEKLVQTT